MLLSNQFELAAFLSEKFPSLTLGGGLFYRWPIGLRFGLGLEAFRERAIKLYEFVFGPEDNCVIVSQDSPLDLSPEARKRYFQVFSLPGAFDSNIRLGLPSWDVTTEQSGEQETFSLQWAQLPARSFRYGSVLEGIANADHTRTPSVSGCVYFLNPAAEIIAHMYDDRGMDIIAARRDALIPIYQTFKHWILEFDRERIAKDFTP